MRETNRELEILVDSYLSVSSLRPKVLFENFLPTGYEQTTLSSVSEKHRATLILAKLRLGMIITLYDDLADHPDHLNPDLLRHLYGLNIDQFHFKPDDLAPSERKLLDLAGLLFRQLTDALKVFPHYTRLVETLRFDIEQIYNCNRFSALATLHPEIMNPTESRLLGPHNMGIVAAGTMDLMASPEASFAELGTCREAFHQGQRMGRISNVLVTHNREILEGDQTNEIYVNRHRQDKISYALELQKEFSALHDSIKRLTVQTFSVAKYAEGLLDFHRLHVKLEGQI